MSTSVFISGANGFIAQHIIALLLSKGYSVVGSVRSPAKGEKLKELYGSKFQYEVVPVLEKQGAFDDALKNHPEVTIFLHSASPAAIFVEDNEKDTLIPAINGTKFVLESVQKTSPQIKRFVYTSSILTIAYRELFSDPNFVASEEVYNPITYEEGKNNTGLDAYVASKSLAEKAAWDYVNKNKPQYTFSTVNPVCVLGPQAKDEEAKGSLSSTAEIINSVYKLTKDDKISEIGGQFVDVRDVAKAHVLAFEKDEAQGKRIITYTENFNPQLILNIIRKNFPELRERLPVGDPDNVNFSSYAKIDDKKSREILGIESISLEDSVISTVEQAIRAQN
ncbi:protein induced by osmotic stress [Scheffersomyces xylosifermentans]|uniref:protein induced by osmotic stress n=1 Tax=Scheffersomyces xylosifermentans TaxID=1304137 RepID=UPI00315D7989